MGGEAHRIFTFSMRVPYAHTDQMGMVYYANYLVYFEMARAALMREVGLPYGELEKRGVYLPVVEAHCEYRKPARFDQLVEVRSRCTEFRGVRLRIEYEVVGDGELLATGYTHHVCMTRDGKVVRPVAEVRNLVQLRGS
jgi:acyl-CoA thioester hydrolase